MKTVIKVKSRIIQTVSVLVDETLSVEEMVVMGKFTCSNSLITSDRFPKLEGPKKVIKKIALYGFNRKVSSEVAISEMKKRGYVPIRIWELLSLAAKDPNLQRNYLIPALGSVCEIEGVPHIAFIYGFSLSRQLRLYKADNEWGDICRIAAMRE